MAVSDRPRGRPADARFIDPDLLAERANEVAQRLALMASAPRLLVLCQLAKEGECSVTALQDAVGLSQSALSQHLARLRNAGTVATRRDGQTILYSLADPKTRELMEAMYDIFCAAD